MRVFVNSQTFDVEGDSLSGAQIKALSQTDGRESVLQLRGEHRALVADNEIASLQGDDQFVTVPAAAHAGGGDAQRVITIYVDGDPYKTDQRVLTGEQIKALAKKPPGNRLFRITDDGQRHQIADDPKSRLLHLFSEPFSGYTSLNRNLLSTHYVTRGFQRNEPAQWAALNGAVSKLRVERLRSG